MNIKIGVVNRVATPPSNAAIVCGNSGYTITFAFDAEWASETAKVARFVWFSKNKPYSEEIEFGGDTVAVPILANTNAVYVGVYAGNLHTTTAAKIACEPSILCYGQESDVNPTTLSQIKGQIAALTKALKDVNVDPAEIESAVNAALAQAKASGEFNGQPGQPGKDGKDYVLTDSDRAEIAEMAAELVDVPDSDNSQVFVAQYGKTTNAEIFEAFSDGKICFVKQAGAFFPSTGAIMTEGAHFGGVYRGVLIEIQCRFDEWSRVNRPETTEITAESTHEQRPTAKAVYDLVKEHSGSAFVINATDNGDGTFTADKTNAEIYEAYVAQRPMYMVCAIDVDTVILSPTIVVEDAAVFAAVAGNANFTAMLLGNDGQLMFDSIATEEWVQEQLAQHSGGNADQVSIEPAEDDVPKVFITGVKPTSKTDVLAEMQYISKTESFHAYLEIKCQGSSSMSYPKKNFTVKLYSDEARETKQKKVFKDWGIESNKFVLKANYIDHSHARNVVSARIWDAIVKSRADYDSLPEEMRNSPQSGAIDGFPVKLYYNGTYEGLYTWNIGKDAWMWGMDEDNANHVLLSCCYNDNGVLLEKAGNFRALWSGTDGDNWDIEVGSASTTLTASLNALISCVKDTDDETFKATIGTYLDINSALDYYLYFWANAGLDSLENNMLLATYDGVKWICGAYDMDSVWGLHYKGSKFISTDFVCPDEYQGPYSLLWERITALFVPELKAKYAELRSGVLSYPNIVTHFERFMDVIGLDLYAEDLTIYTGIPSGSTNNIQQIRNYVRDRLVYVDAEVEALAQAVPCTGITLDSSTLTFTAEGSQTLTATVTPDGCTDEITWASDDTSIATVADGVVTAVANGSCSITATCGEYSATCAVAVSGMDEPVPCTGITLSANTLTFDGEGTQTITATVTPDGCTDSVVWVSSAPSVASITVEGNVCTVQSVSNGDAVITVTCGDYSASCSVSVSGALETAYAWLRGSDFSNDLVSTDGSGSFSDAANGTAINFSGFAGDASSGSDGSGAIVTSGAETMSATYTGTSTSSFTIIYKGSLTAGQSRKYVLRAAGDSLAVLFGYVDNTVEVYSSAAATKAIRDGSQIVIADGLEHSFAYAWDGATLRGYLDGTEVVNVAKTGIGSWTVGAFNYHGAAGKNLLEGAVKHIKFYTTALTEAQIQTVLSQL